MLTQSTIYYPDSNSTEKTDETYEGKPFLESIMANLIHF